MIIKHLFFVNGRTNQVVGPNETLEWQGALSALQAQMELPVHLGGPSAIAFQGSSHYARMGKETIFLFTPLKVRLPKWFYDYDWEQPIVHVRTASLPSDLGTNIYPYADMKIGVSTVERAILECLYLEQKEKEKAEYGSYIIKELSLKLKKKYGKGFAISTLKDIRQFYLSYSDHSPIGHALRGQSKQRLK